jgi:hypothetical protein
MKKQIEQALLISPVFSPTIRFSNLQSDNEHRPLQFAAYNLQFISQEQRNSTLSQSEDEENFHNLQHSSSDDSDAEIWLCDWETCVFRSLLGWWTYSGFAHE